MDAITAAMQFKSVKHTDSLGSTIVFTASDDQLQNLSNLPLLKDKNLKVTIDIMDEDKS